MVTVEVVSTADGLAAVLAIRAEVFVGEQHVPIELERDDADHAPGTVHVLAMLDAVAVGTARLLPPRAPGTAVHIGRVAVRRSARGQGVGAALMRALEAEAWRRHAARVWSGQEGQSSDVVGPLRIELSAQETAAAFYERLGYAVAGRRYLEAGLWHRDAVRTLTGPPAVGT